jgi:hypothetical protein
MQMASTVRNINYRHMEPEIERGGILSCMMQIASTVRNINCRHLKHKIEKIEMGGI